MLNTFESPVKTALFSQAGFAEIRTDVITGTRSLFSKQTFQINDVICPFSWAFVYESPTYLTVQIGEKEHIELLPTFLECLNHSCSPNCFLDTTLKQLMCIKPIKPGDELTFFYPSAEWDMDQPFTCECGSENCIGLVKGAKYLPKKALADYQFTDFIQQKFQST